MNLVPLDSKNSDLSTNIRLYSFWKGYKIKTQKGKEIFSLSVFEMVNHEVC